MHYFEYLKLQIGDVFLIHNSYRPSTIAYDT